MRPTAIAVVLLAAPAAFAQVADGDIVVKNTTVTTTTPRQAPSFALPVISNTAPFLKCFGLGVSGADGGSAIGGALGWCWIQRDAYARDQFDTFSALCLPDVAARAYCSTRLNARPFGGRDDCELTLAASVSERCGR